MIDSTVNAKLEEEKIFGSINPCNAQGRLFAAQEGRAGCILHRSLGAVTGAFIIWMQATSAPSRRNKKPTHHGLCIIFHRVHFHAFSVQIALLKGSDLLTLSMKIYNFQNGFPAAIPILLLY
jgi:hypothetical protein